MVLTAKPNNPNDLTEPVEYICDIRPMKDDAGNPVLDKDGKPRNVTDDSEIIFKNRLDGLIYGLRVIPQDVPKIDKQKQFRIVFDVPILEKE